MFRQRKNRCFSVLLSVVVTLSLISAMAVPAYADYSKSLTISPLTDTDIGLSAVAVSEASTQFRGDAAWTASGTSITGTATGFTLGTYVKIYCHVTTTLTIENKKDSQAQLSFNYTTTLNGGSINAGGLTNASDHYEGLLEPGGTVTVKLTSPDGDTTSTVNITNISLVAVGVNPQITFQTATGGSYTVDGEQITEETTKSDKAAEDGYAVAATPANGYKFFGWYSVLTGSYVSRDQSTTLKLEKDQTVYPVFVSVDTAIFETGGEWFTDLNEANASATANGTGKITLIQDGTLPGESYTITSGNTLLIPFDNDGTCYTTEPGLTNASYSTPTLFRKLTMSPGAIITVDSGGAISVSAKFNAAGGGGDAKCSTTGPYGCIDMQGGSSIVVNGALYCYGYITGSGEITANSTANIHEAFEMREFRGGNGLAGMNNNSNKVFPVSQYYVQNIEAPLTMQAGATLTAHTAIYILTAPFDGAYPTSVTIIGKDSGLFLLTSGTLTKRYLPTEDRCQFDVNGDVTISGVTLSLSTGLLSYTFDSSKYVLPINGHFNINLKSGKVTVGNDIEFLPGVKLTIDQGAELEVASGKSLYIYDSAEWGTNFVFSNKSIAASAYSPTRTKTRTAADLTDALVDVNGTITAIGYIYTTSSGANIISSKGTGTVKLVNGSGGGTAIYQVTGQSGSGLTAEITYATIPITSAKLHNGSQYVGTEEEYTTTDGAAAGTTYYFCNDTGCQKWYTHKVNFYISGKLADTVHITSGNSVTYNIINMDTCDYSGYSYNAETGVLTINNLTNPEIDVYLTLKEIISVTIEWGSLNFVYTKGAWNPQTHTYQVGTIGPESEGANIVTITNSADTNIDLVAHVAYSEGDYTGAVTGTLEYGESSGISLEIELTQGDTAAKKVSLTLSPNSALTEGDTVGTITVTISKPDEGGS